MPDWMDDFVDGLKSEVMTTMAEDFFSARKKLDDMLERFEKRAVQVRAQLHETVRLGRVLHTLLVDEQTVRAFYRTIGSDAEPFLRVFAAEEDTGPDRMYCRHAFTARGKFVRTAYAAYRDFQKAAIEYLDGHYENDPERKGRKRMTPNRGQLLQAAIVINEEVEQVNRNRSPACALEFMGSLDPEHRQKQKVAGATLNGFACDFDEKMAFAPLDFEDYELPELPELPRARHVSKEVHGFSRQIWAEHRDELQPIMRRLCAKKR